MDGGADGLKGALLNPMSMTDAELLDSVPMEKSNGDQMNTDMKMKPVGGEENHTDAVKSDAAEKLTSEIKELKVTISKLEADNADLREELSLTNASMTTFGLRQNYCYYPSFPLVSLCLRNFHAPFPSYLSYTGLQGNINRESYPFTYFDTSAFKVLAHTSKDA